MSRLTILYYCSKKLYTLEIIKVISTDSNLQNINDKGLWLHPTLKNCFFNKHIPDLL